MAASPAVGLAPSPGSQLGSASGQQRSVGKILNVYKVSTCLLKDEVKRNLCIFMCVFAAGMALSPGSSINTPGQAQPNPSPLAQSANEEQAYREKIRHLSKYIDPLRRMIAHMRGGNVY